MSNPYPDYKRNTITVPAPCPTCEALARTVMMDQTSHDTPPPARSKPLTRATIADARDYLNTNDKAMWVLGWNECVEAHSIKEQP